MTKYLLIAGTLFVLTGFITGFAVYKPSTSTPSDIDIYFPNYLSCEEYTAKVKKAAAEAISKGLTIYQMVDADKYECKNEPAPTYVPTATPYVPLSSPAK